MGGCALGTYKMLKLIEDKPAEYVPLFKKDPMAFAWESIRIRGGGGSGMNPFIVPETSTYTIAGQTFVEEAGRMGFMVTLHGNHDPKVFGGPGKTKEDRDAYARAFIPGRENADRVLNFMAEPRDIRKCPNMTGCEHAPRFCMGTFICPRMMAQFGSWYVEGRDAGAGKGG